MVIGLIECGDAMNRRIVFSLLLLSVTAIQPASASIILSGLSATNTDASGISITASGACTARVTPMKA